MKKLLLTGLLIATTFFISAQKADDLINVKEVERIESILAADEMMGRRAFTPHIDKAADFIADEFEKAGLQHFPGLNGFKQEFTMVRTRFVSATGTWDGMELNSRDIIVATSKPVLKIDQLSGYEKIRIAAGANLAAEARKALGANKDQLVLVDRSFASNFSSLIRMKSSLFKSNYSVVFVLTDSDPSSFQIEATHEINEFQLSNVVGVIPGKSRPDEFVVFSAHYDHIGTRRGAEGDSIFNGANDDASGTTAVILLAEYFKRQANNERTILFAAFTAEEIGGYGSQYFSRQLDPAKVVAMFNIEMIGTESKWGKNSAFITGYEKTDMGAIMQKNLEGTGFSFHPDPYPDQNLFFRSDNATLARLGVPAHSISTAKMESEPHYHKVSDEIGTLDLENMAMIIRSIALSANSIIMGIDTPTRVK